MSPPQWRRMGFWEDMVGAWDVVVGLDGKVCNVRERQDGGNEEQVSPTRLRSTSNISFNCRPQAIAGRFWRGSRVGETRWGHRGESLKFGLERVPDGLALFQSSKPEKRQGPPMKSNYSKRWLAVLNNC